MSRAYNVIDADGHILEPLDLWAKYMDSKFRDCALRLVTDNETGEEKLWSSSRCSAASRAWAGSAGSVRARGEIKAAEDEIRGRPPRRVLTRTSASPIWIWTASTPRFL